MHSNKLQDKIDRCNVGIEYLKMTSRGQQGHFDGYQNGRQRSIEHRKIGVNEVLSTEK